jgi:diguanylate cyclase (GGDEF)-like protein
MPQSSTQHLKHLNQIRRPVVGRSIALLTAFCLLLVGVLGWSLWTAHQDQLDETAATTANMALALATQAETSFKLADAILAETVERVERDGVEGGAGTRLHERLVRIVASTAEVQGVFVYDADGSWLANALPAPVKANNADREYFRYHQAHPGRGTLVGKPVRSRSTGILVVPVSRRIDRPDGSFGGVALVTLDLGYFGRFYERFDIGREGAIVLALDDGILLYRRPFSEALVGKDLSNGPIFQTMRKTGPVGTAMLKSGVDGVERLYSFRHLEGHPLLVASAQSREEILRDWRRTAIKTGCVVAFAVAVLAWGGRRMIRQIRIREGLEAELREAGAVLARQNERLKKQAESDGLTGLANRRLLDAALARELARARRAGGSFALLMCDVDLFKKYNDRYGHVAGDDCLRRVAAAVKQGARRPGDLAARYGGEEFVLLLPNTDLAGAATVAESVRAAVAGMAIAHEDSATGTLSLSLGVVAGRPGPEPDGAWIEAADRQLYEAKAGGRNRVAAQAMQVAAPDPGGAAG